MSNCKIYADKIYADRDLNDRLQANQNSIILTAAKKKKGQKILCILIVLSIITLLPFFVINANQG